MKEEIIEDTTVALRPAPIRRISWPAVFAGLIITLAVELLLSVLGVSIGASMANPMTQQNPGEGLGTGAGVWLVVTGIISLFFGGWVAGRMSGLVRGSEGALQGLITWGSATLLAMCLLSTAAGAALSGTAKLLSQVIPINAEMMASTPQFEGGVGNALQNGGSGSGNSVRQETQAIEQKNAASQQDNSNQSQQKDQASQKTRQAGQTATKGISTAGWWSFGVLVLGALAAALGGASGARAFLRARVEIPVVVT